jgi:putative transcriptional regulator
LKPNHHLDHSTILAYAAGTLDEAFKVVVASHVTLCEHCRKAVREAESVGGELLEALPRSDVSVECRSRTLAALDQSDPAERTAVPPATSEIPLPLAGLMSASRFGDIAWTRIAPGVAMCGIRLPAHAKGQLKLLRIAPGRAVPEHGHGGDEITLVLKGAYCDHLGRFGAGDVADLDEDIEHKPAVDGDEECICLIATEQPTRFKSLAARLVQPFTGF